MKPFSITLLCAAICLLYPMQSLAYGEYYVELGSESSEEEAIAQWKILSKKHSEVLGNLQFFPTTVLHKSENRVSTRIQAGPLPAKLDAYRICGKLFEDNIPCFVVEGQNHAESVRTVRAQQEEFRQATVTLPWLAGESASTASEPEMLASQSSGEFAPQPVTVSEAETAAEDTDEGGFFSWIFGSGDAEEAMPEEDQPVASASRRESQGEVEVAEAIRVPLSQENNQSVRPQFVERAVPVPAPLIQPEPEDRRMLANPGWVNVERFAEEEQASLFWQAVRADAPVQTAGLRVRVIRPLIERETPSVSLNIGPFADRGDAVNFCQEIIRRKNSDLSCVFQNQEPQAVVSSQLVAPRYQHTERYQRRRQVIESRYGRRGSSMLAPAANTKVYWVQVATADTQIKALQRWDDLREEHPDLLEGLRSSVSATLMQGTNYMVKVGPLDSGSAATELCSSLKIRGVECKIYSNM